jgi:hypothetical protein
MAKILIVNNTPYAYPQPGEQAPWGEGATGWAEEVTRVLGTLKGSADILESSYIIDNNVTSPLPIGGLFFDVNLVRGFSVEATVYRTYGATQQTELITLSGLNQGAAGWLLQQDGIGSSGISLSIDASGQVNYTSTNIPQPNIGDVYSGVITFRGIGILTI